MKPLRLIVDVIFLAAGAALGVSWGVHHPTEAAGIVEREQIASSKAKIEFLTRFAGSISNSGQMIADEQKKLDAANQALGNLPPP